MADQSDRNPIFTVDVRLAASIFTGMLTATRSIFGAPFSYLPGGSNRIFTTPGVDWSVSRHAGVGALIRQPKSACV